MTRTFKALAAITTLLFCIGFGSNANAATIVNGDFETGDLSGWTLANSSGTAFTTWVTTAGQVAPFAPHGGTYFLATGENGHAMSLSQTFATTPGETYNFSFWLEVNSGGSAPVNSFTASFGGVTLLSLVNAADFGYQQFAYEVQATSTTTTVEFQARNDPYGWGLDDVSASAVPEPGTFTLVGSLLACGLAAGAFGRRRK